MTIFLILTIAQIGGSISPQYIPMRSMDECVWTRPAVVRDARRRVTDDYAVRGECRVLTPPAK